MFDKIKKEDHVVFVSRTHDSKKNPLEFGDKIRFLKKAFPEINFSDDSAVISIFHALVKLNGDFENVTMMVGQDRVDEIVKKVTPYLNNPAKDPNFQFHFSVKSAGARDPKSRGAVKGISASKMRQFAKNNDYLKFESGAPRNLSHSDVSLMMKLTRQGMGLE